jgi:hypothetical protein
MKIIKDMIYGYVDYMETQPDGAQDLKWNRNILMSNVSYGP